MKYGTAIPDGTSVVLHVDFLAEFMAVHSHHRYTYERGQRFTDALARMSGVLEVIDSHQCWLKYEVQGRFFECAPIELAQLKAKVARLTARYTKGGA